MDGDQKKLVIFAVLAGISGVATYFVNRKLTYYKIKMQEIKDTTEIHSPTSLLSHKDDFSKEPKFVMINGACVRLKDKHRHKNEEDMTLYLYDHINRKKKIYVSEFEVSLNKDRHTIWRQNKFEKDSFLLVDPIKPENRVVVFPGKDAMPHNLPQKRKFLRSAYDYVKKTTEYYEKLSMIAYEGSTLTLLGMIKFNPQNNELQLTEVTGFISGGIKECAKFLEQQMQHWKAGLYVGAGLTLIFSSLAAYIMYAKVNAWMIGKKMNQHNLENLQLQRFPSIVVNNEGVACLICTENASNVISIPCNHLSMCLNCFSDLKKRYLDGQSRQFQCPVCRTPMDENNYIRVGYKKDEKMNYLNSIKNNQANINGQQLQNHDGPEPQNHQ